MSAEGFVTMGIADDDETGGGQRSNWLRAAVLGATDGVVSVAAIVAGVAGATASTFAVTSAGAAALIGGAISMALGEYVSVSSQRDTEWAQRRRRDGRASRAGLASPWLAAGASAGAFAAGGSLPFLAALLGPELRVAVVFGAVLLVLAGTGWLSARLAGLSPYRPAARVVLGGAAALGVTFFVGSLFGTVIA